MVSSKLIAVCVKWGIEKDLFLAMGLICWLGVLKTFVILGMFV